MPLQEESEHCCNLIDRLITDIKKLLAQHFPQEVVGKETNLSKNLGLVLDLDGVFRSKGRITRTK